MKNIRENFKRALGISINKLFWKDDKMKYIGLKNKTRICFLNVKKLYPKPDKRNHESDKSAILSTLNKIMFSKVNKSKTSC